MGYVNRNLMAGEEVLLRPRYHPVRFLPGSLGILLGAIVAAGAVVLPAGSASPGILLAVGAAIALVGLLAIALRAVVDSFDEFAITSFRIIKKTGFLTRQVSRSRSTRCRICVWWRRSGSLAFVWKCRGRVGR